MNEDTLNGDFDGEQDKGSDEGDFAAMLEAHERVTRNDVFAGEKIEGDVIAITHDTIFMDIGAKIDGMAVRDEFVDEKGHMPLKVGDRLALFVTAVSENEIHLSKSVSGRGTMDSLKIAFENKVPVEGKVKEVCKGGFIVDIMGFRAFCPISQIDVDYVETPEDFIGHTHRFQIMRLESAGRNIVLSRRVLLEEARRETRTQFVQNLQVGDLREGTVTRLMPYGAFVQLCPGLEGMVHISELSWSRIDKPDQVVQAGDRIQVKVIQIQSQGGASDLKIGLSVKQVTGDPWETLPQSLQPGAKVTGRVTRCAPFGAFVEVLPGIEGLVHISEMSYVKRVVQPEDIVSPGETVSVMVKSIDPENRKLALSIRDAVGDPWLDVEEKYSSGQKVNATVEKKENFGYLVTLEPGITGLLPASRIHKASRPDRLEKLKAGDGLVVVVESVDPVKRRVSLLPGDSADSDNWQQYSPDKGGKMSPLAEKLQAALASGKGKKKS